MKDSLHAQYSAICRSASKSQFGQVSKKSWPIQDNPYFDKMQILDIGKVKQLKKLISSATVSALLTCQIPSLVFENLYESYLGSNINQYGFIH